MSSYIEPKTNTDLLAAKIRPKMVHILVFLSELFTIFWCNSPLIMVQLRTNFYSQHISATFWCNIGQIFLSVEQKFMDGIVLNFMLSCILSETDTNFGTYRSRGSTIVRNFRFL